MSCGDGIQRDDTDRDLLDVPLPPELLRVRCFLARRAGSIDWLHHKQDSPGTMWRTTENASRT